MKILVTGANHPITRTAIAALSASHQIVAVDVAFDQAVDGAQTQTGDLREQTFVNAILDSNDIEAVMHFAPLTQPFPEGLDNLDQASRGTYQLVERAAELGIARWVSGSSLQIYAGVAAEYAPTSDWRRRPRARLDELALHAAEFLVRECVRIGTMQAVCLRFSHATADEIGQAVVQALEPGTLNWSIHHVGKRVAPSGDAGITVPPKPIVKRPIKKVLILGAAGPIATATAQAMCDQYVLRLTDIRPFEEMVATTQPQSPGAPLPVMLPAPHDTQVVDVTKLDDVMRAAEGMDAIVNLTVMRKHPVETWRVNLLGAWNVMQAAVAHGIHRVVHTGPWMIGRADGAGYHWDDWVVDEVPPRPGAYFDMYLSSKMIGQEIVRVMAETYDLCVPALQFCGFVNPDQLPENFVPGPFYSSWMDTARAIKAAVDIDGLPSPFEILFINDDLPHSVYPNAKAKRMLNWKPVDDLGRFCRRD